MSITWITPLLAAISACVTCALSTITPPFISPDGDAPTFNSLGGIELDEFLGYHLARYYMIRENALQFGVVLRLEQAFHSTGRQLGKGFVGGREHRERAGPFQRVHQARGFHRGYQGLELSGSGCRLAEGDAIYFDSTVPHGYRRVGARRTTALVVALGPRE